MVTGKRQFEPFSQKSQLISCFFLFAGKAVYTFQKAAILSMLPEEEVTKRGENVVELFK